MQKPKLNRRQAEYIRFCERMKAKYSRKAVAARMGIPLQTVCRYADGRSIPIEDWTARQAIRQEARAMGAA